MLLHFWIATTLCSSDIAKEALQMQKKTGFAAEGIDKRGISSVLKQNQKNWFVLKSFIAIWRHESVLNWLDSLPDLQVRAKDFIYPLWK